MFKGKLLAIVFSVFSLCVLLYGVNVFAEPLSESANERIENFRTTITVNKDSSVDISESITYNPAGLEKHGIFRDIPTKVNKKIVIDNVEIKDENGVPYQFSISRELGNLHIKIGDPNVTFSEPKTYVINYHVSRAIGYFDSYDEIYWNATGNSWDFPILKSSAKVILPFGTNATQISCYVGLTGSKEECLAGQNEISQGWNISFESPKILLQDEGLTVAVGFPKRVVAEPTTGQKIKYFLEDNIGFMLAPILPILVFIFLFKKWRKKGKDPKKSGVITAEYEAPNNLTPMEISGILKQKLGDKAIPSEIISLAVRGYLKITQIEKKILVFKSKDYRLELLKDPDDMLLPFDKLLLNGLFDGKKEIELSDLKNHFYAKIPAIEKSVFVSLVSKDYFKESPSKVQTRFFVGGIIILFVSLFLSAPFIAFSGYYLGFFGSLSIMLGFFVSSLLFIIFAWLMPARTEKGVIAFEKILGLKEYLQIAEKDRLNFHNAPEKKPEIFEKLLPYAIALGVEKAWAKEFEGIYMQNPSWYSGAYGTSFNAGVFASELSSFSATAGSSLSSAPGGSGGGGASGGGGGGGGGGSW